MKKCLCLVLLILVFYSFETLASKARLEALGDSSTGSMYIEDARNVLLNPAQLNFHRDFITMEWGNTNQESSNNDVDGAATPKAEGGMFRSYGSMVYGLYFGSESDESNTYRSAAGVETEQNNTDVFIAGDFGLQWGLRYTYHSYKDEQATVEKESQANRLRVGLIGGNTEGFAKLGMSNKSKNDGGAEYEQNSSYEVGVTQILGDIDLMARASSLEATENDSGDEIKSQSVYIGAAKQYKLNDSANAWTSAWFRKDNYECETTFSASCDGSDEKQDTYVPVIVSLEVAVKDWLSLRGSVSHEVFGQSENGDGDAKTREDTTKVAAGATLTFGDLALDGMIGNSKRVEDTAGEDSDTIGSDTSSGNGTLRGDTLMSRLSITYKF